MIFTTDFQNVSAVLSNESIPANRLQYYHAQHKHVLRTWEVAFTSDTLGPYNSPPRTWTDRISREPNKTAKMQTNDSPRSGNQQRQQGAPQQKGSFPQFGCLKLLSGNLPRQGPKLTDGARGCPKFMTRGESCDLGDVCTFRHFSLKNASLADLRGIDNWVNSTQGVSWVHRPAELTTSTAPSPPSGSRQAPSSSTPARSPTAPSPPNPPAAAPAPAAPGSTTG